jgi:tetratricopeptide (TPR) repeat protein
MRQLESAIDAALAAGEVARAEEAAARYCRLAGRGPSTNQLAHDPWLRANYQAAQIALMAGQLRRALNHLELVLPWVGKLRDGGLAAWIRVLTAEAYVRLRRSAEARAQMREVPAALLEKEGMTLLRFRALRVRLGLGEVGAVDEELRACAAALGSCHDTANLSVLACDEGRAWEQAGDLAKAHECWQRAERLSGSLEKDSIRAGVLLQLGRLDHLRGHLASALRRYDAALSCVGQGVHAHEVEWRRLLVRLEFEPWDQLRTEAGRLRARRPLDELPEEVGPVAEMVCGLLDGRTPTRATNEMRAYQAALRGDVEAARTLYVLALADSSSPVRHARCALALGMLALTCRDREGARSWLRQAEELARSQDLPEVLLRALQACGQMAAEEEGTEQLARKLFEEAVLITEVQAGLLAHGYDAATYRWQRGSVVRRLLGTACRSENAEKVFRYQELDRGRLLLDLWRAEAPESGRDPFFERPDFINLELQITACEKELQSLSITPASGERYRDVLRQREEALLHRHRLFEEFLRSRRRSDTSFLPALPELKDLQQVLSARTLYVAPSLVDEELYLLAASREEARLLRGEGSVAGLRQTLDSLRGCLASQMARYRTGLSLGPVERAQLDGLLEDVGRSPLGDALLQAWASFRPQRLVWVPDDPLHGLPIHALRWREGRYLVQDLEVVWTFSGALYVHQARTRHRTRGWLRPTLVVTETPEVLPEAAREGRCVAGSFVWHHLLHGPAATRTALTRIIHQAHFH